MIETLQAIDEAIFACLNGAHCPLADNFLWLMTGKWAYILMGAALLYVIIRKKSAWGLMMVLAIAVTVLLSDQISSSLIKPLVCRLRPSHNPNLCAYVLNGYRGGMYGFVSSHAANSFGVAMLVWLFMRGRAVALWLFGWAALVSYSRIYLGVHYFGDIFCGAVLGMAIAVAVYCLAKHLAEKRGYDTTFAAKERKIFSTSIWGNVAVLLMFAVLQL
ncbi:MAG: phosphatase PAP2 family protein [Muribaculaceae bacterium]